MNINCRGKSLFAAFSLSFLISDAVILSSFSFNKEISASFSTYKIISKMYSTRLNKQSNAFSFNGLTPLVSLPP